MDGAVWELGLKGLAGCPDRGVMVGEGEELPFIH